jgi:hypothetical protein
VAHANARLGPAGRRELVRLTLRLAVHSGCWPRVHGRVGATVIAGTTGVAHWTVHAILKRHGRSRPARTPRDRFVRDEWPCPGDLLHMDVKRYRRFRRPGHPFIADERQTSQELDTRLGYDYFHAIVDDPQPPGLRRATGQHPRRDRHRVHRPRPGVVCRPRHHARRVMTDGACSYTHNRSLHQLLAAHRIRHIITPPYTPRWNGKVERLHQTIDREWARGQLYRNSSARNHALRHWLRHDNHHRPHSSLEGQPPISRAPTL